MLGTADHGYALMTRSLPDYELLRIIKYKERWGYVPLPGDLQEVLEAGDRQKLVQLVEQKSGLVLPQDFDTEARNRTQVRTGLGIDTEYGQWLQQVLCEGDWIKTSAIQLKPRRRADVDWPALVEPNPTRGASA